MRILVLGAVAALAGCGNVAKQADASIDSPDPDAFGCSPTKLACSLSCIDPMTDHGHCGACDIGCTDPEDCVSGHCADATASCFAIKQFNPAAMDGPYTHKLDGKMFYCDMTHGMQYDELGYGQYNVAHAGYDLVSL